MTIDKPTDALIGHRVLVTSVNDAQVQIGTLGTVVDVTENGNLVVYVYGDGIASTAVIDPDALTVTAAPNSRVKVDIPPEVASQVLYHFDGTGYAAGGFFRQLINAAATADPDNRSRLGLGFPDYVRAVVLAKETPGGIEALKLIMRSAG